MTPAPRAPNAAELLREIEHEFPGFRIEEKAGDPLSRWIHWALLVLTCGGQRRYLSDYYTVLGSTLYVPPGWKTLGDAGRVILLRHERVHLRQARRYGRVGFALLYLLPFLPLGLAYGRARLEWEAYEETVRATAEIEGMAAARALEREVVRRFVGPDYGFMWPFPAVVARWYARLLSEVERETGGGSPPPPINPPEPRVAPS